MTTSDKPIHKAPRLFTPQSFEEGTLTLDKDQTHYLKNVMRLGLGAHLRVFNAQDGEWLGEITQSGKKETLLTLKEQLKKQPEATAPIHLLFAPIKKQRMDFLIEKAVELGATHLHPVLTDHTENRHIKPGRIQTQIIEAAEQCERLDIPALSALTPLKEKIARWDRKEKILWAAERIENAPPLEKTSTPAAFLIGPEGGFSANECAILENSDIISPVSLGPRILRAETAALYCLARI